MSKAKLEALGGERYRVSGVLDAETAPALLQQSGERFSSAEGANILVDLGGVAESDSAGLALLIEWLRLAKTRQQRIQFENLPAQMTALARISEVEDLVFAGPAAADGSSSSRPGAERATAGAAG